MEILHIQLPDWSTLALLAYDIEHVLMLALANFGPCVACVACVASGWKPAFKLLCDFHLRYDHSCKIIVNDMELGLILMNYHV